MCAKFVNQQCVHCLNRFDELTKDHVFPESWYPDSTPLNMEKWVVPSCLDCNNKLGSIEDELYKKFAICMTSGDIASSGVSKKVIQKYIFSSEEDERNKGRKLTNLKRLIKDVNWFDNDKLPKNIMKNFGNVAKNSKKSMLVHIPAQLLNPFCEKIIRGLEFRLMDSLVYNNRKIQIIHLPDFTEFVSSEILQLNNILTKDGAKVNRGPGFVVRYVKDVHSSMLYHITIWGKWEIWASISGPGLKIN